MSDPRERELGKGFEQSVLTATIAAKDAEIAELREVLDEVAFVNGDLEDNWVKQVKRVLANPAPIADAMLRVIAEVPELIELARPCAEGHPHEGPHTATHWFPLRGAIRRAGEALADLRAARSDTSAGGGDPDTATASDILGGRR